MKDDIDDKDKWRRLERAVLMVTFLCTVIGTIYSVRTSHLALRISANNLRPWVKVDKVRSSFNDSNLTTRFHCANIGDLPAFVEDEADIFIDGIKFKTLSHSNSSIASTSLLMPGQDQWSSGFTVKSQTAESLINGSFTGVFEIEIKIRYGTSKDNLCYLTQHRLRFDRDRFQKYLNESNSNDTAWYTLGGDFK